MDRTRPASGEMEVTLVLAGTPTPTADRWGTAILIRTETTTLLLDAGPGVTRRLVESRVSPTDVDAVCFTHHHFDHNAGFPGLFLSRWDQGAGRLAELSIYGPPSTADFVERLFAPDTGAFWPDLHARMEAAPSHAVYRNRGGIMPRLAPDPAVGELGPGDTLTVGDMEVRVGLARHVQPYLESNAYRVSVGSTSIVYTGDTEPCEEIVELATGCDVLISMCWDEEERMVALGESPGQTGTRGAARMAQEARAGALVLTHVGPELGSALDAPEEAAMRETYDGPIILGHELTRFVVHPGVRPELRE